MGKMKVAHGGKAWGRGDVPPHVSKVMGMRKRSSSKRLDHSPWAQRWRYMLACGWL